MLDDGVGLDFGLKEKRTGPLRGRLQVCIKLIRVQFVAKETDSISLESMSCGAMS